MNWIKKAINNLKKIDLNRAKETDSKYLEKVRIAIYHQRREWTNRKRKQARRVKNYHKITKSTEEYRIICEELEIERREVARSIGYAPDSISKALWVGFCSERVELAISEFIQKKLKITDVLPADLNKKLKEI